SLCCLNRNYAHVLSHHCGACEPCAAIEPPRMVCAVSIENPKDVPEQWRPIFDRRGIEFTYRALSRRAEGVSLNTIVRALTGAGKTTDRVAGKLSDALGISAERFYELRGVPVEEPFSLPARASQLSARERDAVMGVVDAI